MPLLSRASASSSSFSRAPIPAGCEAPYLPAAVWFTASCAYTPLAANINPENIQQADFFSSAMTAPLTLYLSLGVHYCQWQVQKSRRTFLVVGNGAIVG
ncbi:MAG: hypothetical protein Q8O64_02600 [Sideroxyarcus sp.]|nr:hypothetical protein [Sideroxyarcus sp.]